MNDIENKRALRLLGIDNALALAEIYGSGACYPTAIVREWQDEQIEERLKQGEEPADIAASVRRSKKTVIRRRDLLFEFKKEEPEPEK